MLAVVSTNAEGYSNMLCHVGTSKHWKFKDHTIQTLSLDVTAAPGVAKLTNWQEATENGLVPLSDVAVRGEAGQVVLSGISLESKITTRFFVADVVSAGAAGEVAV